MYVVHRLDREASGLVLFAKDAQTHRFLCGEFEKRRVQKIYLALVLGRVEREGNVKAPLRAFGSGRMGVAKGGKPCLTRFRVRERFSGATLLEIEPMTGRRHQIRVHLYSLGHPVLGDPLYGSKRPVGGSPRLMLHALELRLAFPEPMSLRAEPGRDFLEVLEAWRSGASPR